MDRQQRTNLLKGVEVKLTKTGKKMFKATFVENGQDRSYWMWDDVNPMIGQQVTYDCWTEGQNEKTGKPFYKAALPKPGQFSPADAAVAMAAKVFSQGPAVSVACRGEEILAKLDEIKALLTKEDGPSSLPRDPSIPF